MTLGALSALATLVLLSSTCRKRCTSSSSACGQVELSILRESASAGPADSAGAGAGKAQSAAISAPHAQRKCGFGLTQRRASHARTARGGPRDGARGIFGRQPALAAIDRPFSGPPLREPARRWQADRSA